MGKKEKQQVIIEAETVDIVEAKEEKKEIGAKCEIRIGLNADGAIYFTIDGTDQSLITISGLLRYAEEEQSRIWASRLTNRS